MKHLTRIRQMRKQYNLTQGELAHLLGIHQTNLSRLENGESTPDLYTGYGLHLIFGGALYDLFPTFFNTIESAIMRRAAELSVRAEFDTPEKQRLLQGMVSRAASNDIPV